MPPSQEVNMTYQSNMQAWTPVIYKGVALFKQVKEMYKCSLKTLICTPEQHTSSELNNKTKAVYISKPDLYKLIFLSRLKLTDKIPSCYLMHCPVLHGNFREEELISMGKSDFVAETCVAHWNMIQKHQKLQPRKYHPKVSSEQCTCCMYTNQLAKGLAKI